MLASIHLATAQQTMQPKQKGPHRCKPYRKESLVLDTSSQYNITLFFLDIVGHLLEFVSKRHCNFLYSQSSRFSIHYFLWRYHHRFVAECGNSNFKLVLDTKLS